MENRSGKTRLSEIIEEWKPKIIFLVIGLILGPFISGWMGWQVTTGTMDSTVQNAVITYRADLCAKRAQTDPGLTPETLKNWTSRRDLAKKWAVLPGENKVDSDVVSECSSLLTS